MPTLTALEKDLAQGLRIARFGRGQATVWWSWRPTSLVRQERLKGWKRGAPGGFKPYGAVACVLIGPTGQIHRPEPLYQTMTACVPFTSEYRTYEPLKPRSRSRYSRTRF